MALPSTGSISMDQVRAELGRTGTISLNDGTVRALAGKASGTISMADLRGKSAVQMRTVTPGSSGGLRGYSSNTGVAVFGGISDASYGGRTITGVYSDNTAASTVTVLVSGSTSPGWTKVWINGTAYSLDTWNSAKGGMASSATVTNAYNIFASNFTVGFS